MVDATVMMDQESVRRSFGSRRSGRRRLSLIGVVVLLSSLLTEPVRAAGPAQPESKAAAAPNPAAPFTFLVIPDTQNYSASTSYDALFSQQMRWIAAQKAPLNLAFVAHLGDIVNTPNAEAEWKRASANLKILDDARIPNSVLPGNHDFDRTTGLGPLYHQYFPVSRYAAGWGTPNASYGGYLGQHQFGPDPVDRQNMNNYALFTAAGMQFLVLNLEYNAPDHAVAWAKRVIAAHPDRRVILATHSYIDTTGALSSEIKRTDGNANSGRDLWNELVSTNCSIFLVVSGHFHQGATGEARRTDTNSCGGTVTSMLSDYQSRNSGGEGWLRYYTFVPQSNEIRAYTYSTHLKTFETDSSSQFTIPYDMTISTTPPPTPPTPTTVAQDWFERSSATGWNSAPTGGAWVLGGIPGHHFVASGTGQMRLTPGHTLTAALPLTESPGSDVKVNFSTPYRPDGAVHASVGARVVGGNDYHASVVTYRSGAVGISLNRGGTRLADGLVPGLTVTTGQKVTVRFQVSGSAPSTLRVKVWATGTGQPADWLLTATDADPSLQRDGGIRLVGYLSKSVTNGPIALRWDDLVVTTS